MESSWRRVKLKWLGKFFGSYIYMIRHGRGSKPPSFWEISSLPEKIVMILGPPGIIFILYQIIFN